MKKLMSLIILMVLISTTIFAGWFGKNKGGLEAIKEKGTLVVGLDATFAPMGFKDKTGNIVGFDIDLAKEVAKRIGVEAVFKPSEWSGIVFELKSKNIDVVWNGMTITENRKKQISFSDSYMSNDQIIITLSTSNLEKKSDLKGKTVGLQLGSSSYTAVSDDAMSKEFKNIKKYNTNVEALLDLKAERIDAVVIDEIVGRYYIAHNGIESFKVLNGNFGQENYGVGIRKEDKNLKNEIDKILNEMKKDGTFDTIYQKWFGKKG